VLQKISLLLGYVDMGQYVRSHLTYMLQTWLQHEYSIKDFPYNLLMCVSQKSFFQ